MAPEVCHYSRSLLPHATSYCLVWGAALLLLRRQTWGKPAGRKMICRWQLHVQPCFFHCIVFFHRFLFVSLSWVGFSWCKQGVHIIMDKYLGVLKPQKWALAFSFCQVDKDSKQHDMCSSSCFKLHRSRTFGRVFESSTVTRFVINLCRSQVCVCVCVCWTFILPILVLDIGLYFTLEHYSC